jgi:antitoxin component of MazEF toxin-antitoxin module
MKANKIYDGSLNTIHISQKNAYQNRRRFTMKHELTVLGKSLGITLPDYILDEIGVRVGENIYLEVNSDTGSILITKKENQDIPVIERKKDSLADLLNHTLKALGDKE